LPPKGKVGFDEEVPSWALPLSPYPVIRPRAGFPPVQGSLPVPGNWMVPQLCTHHPGCVKQASLLPSVLFKGTRIQNKHSNSANILFFF
jgi:hypothetical protein